MVKRFLLVLIALMLPFSALAEATVERMEGEVYFPDQENWTYHFTYAYPHLVGEDYASLAINDTYEMALDEMVQLVLPMFAAAEDMLFDGKNEVIHDFVITCNNDRFLSVLQHRTQTMGEEGTLLTMEALVFDMGGEYVGETLTLRGLVMVGDSSAQIAQAVLPLLYEEYQKLQEAGIAPEDMLEEDFLMEFSPTREFYADEEGNAVFFFPPTLLCEPTFDVPTFTFTPEELNALL